MPTSMNAAPTHAISIATPDCRLSAAKPAMNSFVRADLRATLDWVAGLALQVATSAAARNCVTPNTANTGGGAVRLHEQPADHRPHENGNALQKRGTSIHFRE